MILVVNTNRLYGFACAYYFPSAILVPRTTIQFLIPHHVPAISQANTFFFFFFFFFFLNKKKFSNVNSSTLCHMTTIDNTICTTQTLLELSLKPLLYEWWDKNSYYQATPYSKRKPCYYLSPPLPPPPKKKKKSCSCS